MPDVSINYLAVAVTALIPIAIGALWYSPLLFGKVWVKAHEYTEEDVERVRKAAGRTTLVSLVCYLVMALILSVLISYTGVSTIGQGAVLGVLLWGGFLATVGLTAHMYSEKRIQVYLLDLSFQLVYVVTMSVVLVSWR